VTGAATTQIPAADGGPPVGLSRNRNYQLIWFAGAISGLGDIVFTTATVLWVGAIIAKGQTWAPLAVSGVLFAVMIPVVVLGPLGGVYADRWNRRRTMLVTDLLRALVIGALILVPTVGDGLSIGAKLGLIYAAVAAESAVAQFFRPARFGLFGTLVADPDRERAGSIAQGTDATTGIIGPPLAAPLLISTAYGIQTALAVNAISFLVSFAAVLSVRVPEAPAEAAGEREKRTVWQDMRTGLRFVRGSRTMRVIFAAVVMVTFGAGAVNVLDLFFVTTNLHLKASYYGLLDAAIGIGTVAGSIAFAVIGNRIPAHRAFSVGLLLAGVFVACYSRSTALWVALIVLFVLGFPLAAVNSMVGPMVFREVPRELLGRVLGLLNPVQQIAQAASILISTWLASTVLRNLDGHVLGLHFGPIDTIFFGGGVLIALVGAWAIGAMGRAVPAAAPDAGGTEPTPDVEAPAERVPEVKIPVQPTVDIIEGARTVEPPPTDR